MRIPFFVLFLSIAALTCEANAQTQPPQRPQPPPPQQQPPQQQQPQQPAVIPCPKMQIQGPNRPMRDGEKVSFAANIAGGDPKVQPIFNWSISSGTIIGGQGTRNITVDTTGAGNDRQVIADLLVGGYGYECENRATVTVPVAAPASKVDEFGELPEKDEAGKMDSIVTFLGQSPDRVYLIGYAGRNNVRGYTSDTLRRMKTYLAKTPGIAERVVAMDGGFREQPAFEIWVVPVGAEGPRPTPTIDRREIVYPKPPPRTPVKKP